MTKRFALIGVAAIAMLASAPARAADQFVDYSTMAIDWTGFYAGLHAGGASSRVSASYVGTGFDVSHRGSGAFGGAQAGYNVQSGSWVFGGEADIAFANIRGGTDCPSAVYSCNSDISMLGSLRARAGYAFDKVLVYGTAGLGVGNVRIETVHTGGLATPPSGTPANGQQRTMAGWTIGGGAELAMANNWSVKAEYMYYDLGRRTFDVDSGLSISAHPRLHTIKAGINFRW